MAEQPLVDIQELSIAFGDRRVVDGLSLSIGSGQTLGVVGESGSGKSLSALSLLRLLPLNAEVQASRLSFHGEDILSLDNRRLNRIRGGKIGFVFQEPMSSLNPVFTIGSQIGQVLKTHQQMPRRQRRERVLDLLNQVGLPHPDKKIKAYPHQLSGGQRQRVMLAMAISCQPQLLIADEPTSSLDLVSQRQIIDLIQRLKQEQQMAVLFVSHDLHVVSELADQVLVMRHGRVIEQGRADQLLVAPEKAYTQTLLNSRPCRIKEPVAKNHRPDLLEVKKLTTRFKTGRWFSAAASSSPVIDQVDLQIREGETLGVVGASGCGKTTMARSIVRLVEAESGQVLFQGSDLLTLSSTQLKAVRPKLQMVFQDPMAALNPRMQVADALAEPLKVHQIVPVADIENRINELLAMVGLSNTLKTSYPHQLSGGQRQRVCIARALSLQPQLLICDEVVSALDMTIQAQILSLLSELQQRLNLSYLMISHDLSVVASMAHNVAVMDQGRIVEIGPPAQLFADPQHPATQALIAALPDSQRQRLLSAAQNANPSGNDIP